jgi:inward rectifier potassium channel
MQRGPTRGESSDLAGQITLRAPRRPFSDLYYFLITLSWTRLLLIIVAIFALINSAFALAYMLDGGVTNARPGSFADAFFFSVQTMATIGYGVMAPGSIFANVLVSIEAMSGLTALAVVTGLVFARFSRPTARVRFSRKAVIATRDGVLSLMFRVVNERSNRIVEADTHVVLARQVVTREGERVRNFEDLTLSRGRNALFSLSWTVIHPINDHSPLFGETRESLGASRAMVIASLTGMDETFLQNVHARHAYFADDIVWGMRFADILEELPGQGFTIDYSRFDDLVPADRPSAGVSGAASTDGSGAEVDPATVEFNCPDKVT